MEGVDSLEDYETLVVHREALVVVVAATHPWARRRSIPSPDLAAGDYIAREAGSGTRAVVNDALSRAGIDLVPTLETASLQSVKRTLATGGFSVMSPLAIESEERAGTLQAITVADLELTRELHAVHDRRTRLTGVAHRFWEWLREHPAGS